MISKLQESELRRTRPIFLVVDDMRSMRCLLSTSLRAFGYECVSAENGRAAWRVLNELNPDAVITDLEMPGGDGAELIEKIRSADNVVMRRTLIIICSSLVTRLPHRPVIGSADEVFSKPIDLQRLRSFLQNHFWKSSENN